MTSLGAAWFLSGDKAVNSDSLWAVPRLTQIQRSASPSGSAKPEPAPPAAGLLPLLSTEWCFQGTGPSCSPVFHWVTGLIYGSLLRAYLTSSVHVSIPVYSVIMTRVVLLELKVAMISSCTWNFSRMLLNVKGECGISRDTEAFLLAQISSSPVWCGRTVRVFVYGNSAVFLFSVKVAAWH